ncbi:MAG: hypothetical protein R6V19_01930 [Armatimonadota bacterium]
MKKIVLVGLIVSICAAAYARHVVAPTEPYQEWLEDACVMQPWSLERKRALIEDRDDWIPRLKEWGFNTVIFIPGPGDISPNYPMETLRAAADDYHEAGMKVLMYWSIMHVGHHDAWHEVAGKTPEWWQRDAEGGVVTIYGDKWLCPNTGALEFTAELGIRLAQEMDADGIMLDNNEFYYTDVGATGYCEGCQEAFGAHIRDTLGDEHLRQMGLDPETVKCPLPHEPLWGQWVDWRYKVWREAVAEFRSRVREAMPGTMLCANTQYKYDWMLAVHEQPPSEDVVFSESKNQLAREMTCKLAYGQALADGKPLWNYLGTWRSEDIFRLNPVERVMDDMSTSLAWNCPLWLTAYGLVFRSPAHWWVKGRYEVPPGAQWIRAEGEGPAGSTAVALSSDEPARISISQQPFLEVEPGQTFDVAIRYRTESVVGTGPRVRLNFVDEKHQPPTGEPHRFFVEGEGGTHGWHELRMQDITVPDGAAVLNVEPFLWNAKGTVWWDDVRLMCDGKNLLRNPDFEIAAGDVDDETRRMLIEGLQFRREHEQLYRKTTRWADVGLLVSRHSVDFKQVYNRFPRPTMNAFLDAHLPWAVLLEDQLDPRYLSRFTVVVAPAATCLPEDGLRALAEWVRGGGRLIITGDTGRFTRYGHERDQNMAEALFGCRREQMREPRSAGDGMVQWLPQGDADQEVADGLMEAVSAMGGGEILRVEDAPGGVDIVPWARSRQRSIVLHIDRHAAGESGDISVRMCVPEGWSTPASGNYYELHADERPIDVHTEDGYVRFTVPAPEWYAVAEVQFGG